MGCTCSYGIADADDVAKTTNSAVNSTAGNTATTKQFLGIDANDWVKIGIAAAGGYFIGKKLKKGKK